MHIINWFVKSSKDPTKLALTLKAGIPFLIIAAGWAGFGGVVTEEIGNDFVELIVGLVVLVGQFATGGIALWGLWRKIFITITK